MLLVAVGGALGQVEFEFGGVVEDFVDDEGVLVDDPVGLESDHALFEVVGVGRDLLPPMD